jgi:hypothetical protein
MSPKAGFILLEEIAPRLKAVMPHIKTVGAEDSEELFQDAMAVAAKMLHDLEQRNKNVTPGNVAYYTILHLKSGRRSYSAGRTDVMGSGTALDGRSCVLSFEEPAGTDAETGEEVPLGDMLAGHGDDPSMSATRMLDWDQFLKTHDDRYSELVCDLAVGKNAMEFANNRSESYFRVRQLKEKLAGDVREYFGDDAIADSLRIPGWRGNIQADHERAACRADRRRR